MKKILLFLFSLLIGAGLFTWVIKIVGWPEIKNTLLVFTGWQGLVILGLAFLMALVGTWKWQEILKGTEVKISFKTLLTVYLAGFSIRYLAPIIIAGSEFFQGHLLKKINSISWPKSMASVIIDRILELTVNLMVIFFGIFFFLFKIGLPPIKLGLIFGGVIFLLTLLIVFFYFKSFRRESMAKTLGKIFNHRLNNHPLEVEQEIFNFFKTKKKTMWIGFGLSFLRTGIVYFRTWLLIVFLGKSIGFSSALSILGFTYLAIMIPIPAALGSHEAIQTFTFNALNLGLPTATAFTMIIRGAELSVALFGVIILFRFGLALVKNTFFKKTKYEI